MLEKFDRAQRKIHKDNQTSKVSKKELKKRAKSLDLKISKTFDSIKVFSTQKKTLDLELVELENKVESYNSELLEVKKELGELNNIIEDSKKTKALYTDTLLKVKEELKRKILDKKETIDKINVSNDGHSQFKLELESLYKNLLSFGDHENEDLSSDIESLRLLYSTDRSQNIENKGLISKTKRDLSLLKKEYNKLEFDKALHYADLSLTQNELDGLNETKGQLESQKLSLEKDFDKQKERAKEILDELDKMPDYISNLRQKISDQKRINSSEEINFAKAKTDLSHKKNKFSDLKTKLESLQLKLSTIYERRDELRSSIKHFDDLMTKSVSERKDLELEIHNLSKECQFKTKKLAEIKSDFNERYDYLNSLKKKLKGLQYADLEKRDSLEKYRLSKEEIEQKVAEVSREIARRNKIKEEILKVERDYGRLAPKRDSVFNQLEKEIYKNKKYERDLVSAKNDLKRQQDEVYVANSKILKQELELEKIKHETQKSKEEKIDLEKQKEKLGKKLISLKQECLREEKLCDQLRNELRDFHESKTDYYNEITAYKLRSKESKKSLSKIKSEVSLLLKEKSDLEISYTDAQSYFHQISDTIAKNEDLKERVISQSKELRVKNTELQKRIDSKKVYENICLGDLESLRQDQEKLIETRNTHLKNQKVIDFQIEQLEKDITIYARENKELESKLDEAIFHEKTKQERLQRLEQTLREHKQEGESLRSQISLSGSEASKNKFSLEQEIESLRRRLKHFGLQSSEISIIKTSDYSVKCHLSQTGLEESSIQRVVSEMDSVRSCQAINSNSGLIVHVSFNPMSREFRELRV